MFSAMVRCSIWGSWGTYAMWRRSECCVTCAMSCPSMAMRPPSRSAKRSSSLVSVVLPDPEGPTSPTCSPGSMRRSSPSNSGAPGLVGELQVAELDQARWAPPVPVRRDVDDVGIGGRDAGELRTAPDGPRHQPDELERLLQAGPDEGGIEQDQVDHARSGDVVQRQHDPHRDRGPVEEGHGRLHLQPGRGEDAPGPEVGLQRIAHQRADVAPSHGPRRPGTSPSSGWRWCRR